MLLSKDKVALGKSRYGSKINNGKEVTIPQPNYKGHTITVYCEDFGNETEIYTAQISGGGEILEISGEYRTAQSAVAAAKKEIDKRVSR